MLRVKILFSKMCVKLYVYITNCNQTIIIDTKTEAVLVINVKFHTIFHKLQKLIKNHLIYIY